MKNNFDSLRSKAFVSRDKIIDLLYDLTCRATLHKCLRHTTLAYDKLLHHYYDIKTMICYSFNTALTCKV